MDNVMSISLERQRKKIQDTENELREAKSQRRKNDLMRSLKRLRKELSQCEYYIYGKAGMEK